MTRQAAVLGHPISHSLSPVLHTAAYRALGLNWSYTAIDVTVDEVGEFLSEQPLADYLTTRINEILSSGGITTGTAAGNHRSPTRPK